MKARKLFLSMLAVFTAMAMFTSCEDDGDDPAAVTGPEITFKAKTGYITSDAEVTIGDTVMISYEVNAGDNDLQSVTVRDNDDVKIIDVTDVGKDGKDQYEGEVTIACEAEGTFTYTFIAADEKGEEAIKKIVITVKGLDHVLTYEKTGSILGNKIGPDQSAWDLVTNARKSGSDVTDMQNPSTDQGTVAEQWIKGWDSETTTKFIKATSFDYANATKEAAKAAYDATTGLTQIRDVMLNDVYVAKLRGKDEYAVIKITKVDEAKTTSPRNEEIGFSYKKLSETSGI